MYLIKLMGQLKVLEMSHYNVINFVPWWFDTNILFIKWYDIEKLLISNYVTI